MPDLEIWFFIVTLGSAALGSCGIAWARASHAGKKARWGRRLFIATLLIMGAGSLVAADQRADGLAGLGLTAGLLVVGMLWEAPQRELARSEFS